MKRVAVICGIAAAFAALIICLVPLVEVQYTEREPYTTTETYYEKEPYTESVPIEYRVTDTGIYDWFWSTGSDIWVTIKNTDTKSGYFYVTFSLKTRGGAITSKTASEYIAIGEEKRVQVKHSGDYISTFTYSITPPIKEVTKYRDVTKTREVVKYRKVPKTREVTKYRDVAKTREVIRYRDVPKTKRVTVLEYLLDWASW